MERPWLKLFTRDWLDDPVLRRCSPLARSVLVDLMCLAQEGFPYGHLADKLGPMTPVFMASRCFVSESEFTSAMGELTTMERVHKADSGVLFIRRMVRDEEVRTRRAEGGKMGGNPDLVNHKVNLTTEQRLTTKVNHDVNLSDEGYPSGKPSLAENVTPEGYPGPRARDGRALTLTLTSESSSVEVLREKRVSAAASPNGHHPASERTATIRLWLGQATTAMGLDWGEPDMPLCAKADKASNGATLEMLEALLQKLIRQRRKPGKSFAWFVRVISDEFGGPYAA